MSKKSKIPDQVITAAAAEFVKETESRRSLHAIGIPARLYPAVRADAEEIRGRFRQELSGQMQEVLMDMVTRLRAESGKLSVGQLPVSIGILADKVKAMNEGNATTTQHQHLHIPMSDRDEILRSLLGKHAERIAKQVTPAQPPL